MATPSASAVLLFVGSYTTPVAHAPAAHGRGVSVLRFDPSTRTVATLCEYDGVENPSYLAVDVGRRVLYVTSETYADGEGTVSSLEFAADFASVVARRASATGGQVASYVERLRADVLGVSNYGDGSLASFRLTDFGQLDTESGPGARLSFVTMAGRGPDPLRQTGPHGHCVLTHPSNGLVYAADLGADTIAALSLSDGVLRVVGETKVSAGSGPRHLAFSPDGRTAFVTYELTSRLGVFAVAADGRLTTTQELAMLPDGWQGSSSAADLAVSADGLRVYASNRGHDSVVSYRRDSAGEFVTAGWTATEAVPRSICLTPGGSHLVVANQESDTLQIFGVDDAGLDLVMTAAVATPVCVKSAAFAAAPRETAA